MTRLIAATIASLVVAIFLAHGATKIGEHRSHAVTRAFQHQYPCPSTGRPTGSCPGYVIDHIVPLCAGGVDSKINMQWQTVTDGHAKDRIERRTCRRRT